MNRPFIPFKSTIIPFPFPPYDPHKTMRDHTPKHLDEGDARRLLFSIIYAGQLYFYVLGFISLLGY